jgi:hypothetical protein
VFLLDGLDWRSWSAADLASVTYHVLRRSLTGDDLRDFYDLVGDKDAKAALDRESMGQTSGVELTDVKGRRS